MSKPLPIGDINWNTKIYRIFSRKYFFELFEDKNNALVLPKKWDDPFENVFLRSKVKTASGEISLFDFHNDVYGQCWTLETASDAMWQIYSRNKDAIRVRTTVGKLFESLRAIHDKWADTTCFIGRVEYLRERQLREFGMKIFKNGITPEAIARSLLIKRKAYKHENEVRLIYIERKNTKHAKGVYKYKLDPLAVFEQAMIDGRVTYNDFVPFKKRTVERTKLLDDQVIRSLLYRQPKGFIVEIP